MRCGKLIQSHIFIACSGKGTFMSTQDIIICVAVAIVSVAIGLFFGFVPMKTDKTTESQNKYSQFLGIIAVGLTILLIFQAESRLVGGDFRNDCGLGRRQDPAAAPLGTSPLPVVRARQAEDTVEECEEYQEKVEVPTVTSDRMILRNIRCNRPPSASRI